MSTRSHQNQQSAIPKNAWPHSCSQDVRQCMEEFYLMVNSGSDQGMHQGDIDKFTHLFTSDAIYCFGPHHARGQKEIASMKNQFAKQSSGIRSVSNMIVNRVFCTDNDDNEIMCYGKMHIGGQGGKTQETEWAGYYKLEDAREGMKFNVVKIFPLNLSLERIGSGSSMGSEMESGFDDSMAGRRGM